MFNGGHPESSWKIGLGSRQGKGTSLDSWNGLQRGSSVGDLGMEPTKIYKTNTKHLKKIRYPLSEFEVLSCFVMFCLVFIPGNDIDDLPVILRFCRDST